MNSDHWVGDTIFLQEKDVFLSLLFTSQCSPVANYIRMLLTWNAVMLSLASKPKGQHKQQTTN